MNRKIYGNFIKPNYIKLYQFVSILIVSNFIKQRNNYKLNYHCIIKQHIDSFTPIPFIFNVLTACPLKSMFINHSNFKSGLIEALDSVPQI